MEVYCVCKFTKKRKKEKTHQVFFPFGTIQPNFEWLRLPAKQRAGCSVLRNVSGLEDLSSHTKKFFFKKMLKCYPMAPRKQRSTLPEGRQNSFLYLHEASPAAWWWE